MARGLIVIAPTLGGLQNTIIDKYNGFLYSNYDPLSISNLLDEIVSFSPRFLLEISYNAIYTSSKFTVDHQISILNKAITRCT